VFRRGKHLAKRGDLSVCATGPGGEDERNLPLWIGRDDRPDERNGRIGRIGNAEEDLIPRIILSAETLEILSRLLVDPLDRLQQRYGGGEMDRRATPAKVGSDGKKGKEGVTDRNGQPEKEKQIQDAMDRVNERSRPLLSAWS
jgi:hypothetical protein